MRINVVRWNEFRVPRAGKPSLHVRITRVRTGQHQPKADYVVITRTGNIARPERTATAWLQWAGNHWAVPSHWEAL